MKDNLSTAPKSSEDKPVKISKSEEQPQIMYVALVAASNVTLSTIRAMPIKCGVRIPAGYIGIFTPSALFCKQKVFVTAGVAVGPDNAYELMAQMSESRALVIKAGDAIGTLVLIPAKQMV